MNLVVYDRLARAADRFASASAIEATVAVVASSRLLARSELLSPVDRNDVRYDHGDARNINDARRYMMYLLNTVYGLSLRRIAKPLSLSPEAVRKAIRDVEDARADPRTDRLLDELQLALMGEAA